MLASLRKASAAKSSPAKEGPSSTNVTGLMTNPSARCAWRHAVEAASNTGSPITKSDTTEVSTTQAISTLLALSQSSHRLLRRPPRAARRILTSLRDYASIFFQAGYRVGHRDFANVQFHPRTFGELTQHFRHDFRSVVLDLKCGRDCTHADENTATHSALQALELAIKAGAPRCAGSSYRRHTRASANPRRGPTELRSCPRPCRSRRNGLAWCRWGRFSRGGQRRIR